MKPLLLVIALLLLSPHAFAVDPWTTEQKWLAGAYSVLLWADWKQTKDIARAGREVNPALGPKPSGQAVDRYFLGTAVLSGLALHLLPLEWRTRGLYFGVGTQGHAVWLNWQMGWKF